MLTWTFGAITSTSRSYARGCEVGTTSDIHFLPYRNDQTARTDSAT